MATTAGGAGGGGGGETADTGQYSNEPCIALHFTGKDF